MGSIGGILAAILWMGINASFVQAHREHKIHNIVLYPDKHSWCKTTPIKQVVTWPDCTPQSLDNNVCVGACFSYMVPHSEPSAEGDLILPYCDSCQPSESVWHTVNLDCIDKEKKPITIQKKVQRITHCSCSSCTETSKIKPDYNTLLQSLSEENMDKNVVTVPETPDILLNPHLNVSINTTKDAIQPNEIFQQLFKQLRDNQKVDETPDDTDLLEKFEEKIDLEKFRDLVGKYREEEEHEKHHQSHHKTDKIHTEQQETSEVPHHPSLHRGPHHSMVLESDVKEKIDVEPHYLHPAVAGQEISYHDNVVVDKTEKKDF